MKPNLSPDLFRGMLLGYVVYQLFTLIPAITLGFQGLQAIQLIIAPVYFFTFLFLFYALVWEHTRFARLITVILIVLAVLRLIPILVWMAHRLPEGAKVFNTPFFTHLALSFLAAILAYRLLKLDTIKENA